MGVYNHLKPNTYCWAQNKILGEKIIKPQTRLQNDDRSSGPRWTRQHDATESRSWDSYLALHTHIANCNTSSRTCRTFSIHLRMYIHCPRHWRSPRGAIIQRSVLSRIDKLVEGTGVTRASPFKHFPGDCQLVNFSFTFLSCESHITSDIWGVVCVFVGEKV